MRVGEYSIYTYQAHLFVKLEVVMILQDDVRETVFEMIRGNERPDGIGIPAARMSYNHYNVDQEDKHLVSGWIHLPLEVLGVAMDAFLHLPFLDTPEYARSTYSRTKERWIKVADEHREFFPDPDNINT